jgi:Rap1a immunity proteins
LNNRELSIGRDQKRDRKQGGRMLKIILAAAILSAYITAPHAENYTGNKLHELCEKNKPLIYFYVGGVIDKAEADAEALNRLSNRLDEKLETVSQRMALLAGMHFGLREVQGWCVPKGATLGQAGDVFCKYLRNNPAERNKGASALLTTSLNEVWACNKP